MDDIQKSQIVRLLEFMQKEPEREWIASDFQAAPYFIGYEAGPRLCGLCDMGLATRLGKRERFVVFGLTDIGKKFILTDPLPKLEKKVKGEQKEIEYKRGIVEELTQRGFMSTVAHNGTIWYKKSDILVDISRCHVVLGVSQHHTHYQIGHPRRLLEFLDLLIKYRVG